jgi:hypothetical protein
MPKKVHSTVTNDENNMHRKITIMYIGSKEEIRWKKKAQKIRKEKAARHGKLYRNIKAA